MAALCAARAAGKIGILEIDIQGAKAIRAREKELGVSPVYLFIAPPDQDMLRERLDRRGTETEVGEAAVAFL